VGVYGYVPVRPCLLVCASPSVSLWWCTCAPRCLCPFGCTRAGHDLPSLLYNLLDEFLYRFGADNIVFREVRIVRLALDTQPMRVYAEGYGHTARGTRHAFALGRA
jgi:hypothetical protein